MSFRAFATTGILEGSYRENGIKKGFLNADEYVAFSEQAYAIGVVDYCQVYICLFFILKRKQKVHFVMAMDLLKEPQEEEDLNSFTTLKILKLPIFFLSQFALIPQIIQVFLYLIYYA